MKLAGILGSLASFCSQGTMNGLALVSHLFCSLGTKDPSGIGSNKHKYTEVFAFACGRPIKFCALHIWLTCLLLLSAPTVIYSISNSHVYSMMPQLFFVSLTPWSRWYWSVCQATVSDVQSPEVQEKVWCSASSRELLLHPSCSLLPHSLLLHITRCSRHAPIMGLDTETRHTGQLKSWEVNNSFITCSGWGLSVAPWRQGARERVKRNAVLRL